MFPWYGRVLKNVFSPTFNRKVFVNFSPKETCIRAVTRNYNKNLSHQRHITMSAEDASPATENPLFTASSHDMEAPLVRHLYEESLPLNCYDDSMINMAAGCPGPDLLRKLPDIIRQATEHRMQKECENNYYLFQYGPTAGYWGCRNALVKFLTKNYQSTVSRSDLIMTCGATHGLHLTMSILLSSDAVIFVEEFTYMIALSLLKEFPGHKIVKIPMTKDGIDIKKLEQIVRNMKKEKKTWNTSEDKPFWAMLYTIPTFQNPTGTLLPPESCQKIVELSDELDFLVLCDDVYNLLYFRSGPPKRLYAYEREKMEKNKTRFTKRGHVISNCTFSKILAPGIRVGWMEMSPILVQRFRSSGILQSGGSLNNVMNGVMQSILELGLADTHLEWYRDVYSKRMSTLCESLTEHLPAGCSFNVPDGGYFLWLKLPVDGTDFLKYCREHANFGAVPALRFVPGADEVGAQISDEAYKAIRLSIGFHKDTILVTAAKIIGEQLRNYMKK